MAGLVLIDATPKEICSNKAVQAGFTLSAMLTRLFKVLTPIGVVSFLLAIDNLPFYPEQAAFRGKVSQEDYRNWVWAVGRNLAGNAGDELTSVLDLAASSKHIDAARSQQPEHALPTTVLTSHAYGRKWVAMQQRMASQFQNVLHLILPDRSHNMHMSQPELVAEAAMKMGLRHDTEPAGTLRFI
ncbi:hypothetical protein DFO47_1124 [Arthrobacter sp. AG258]|uniref:hypothetical protein n=1 Tax=Arthrobacter sp. AG258 TaxID=2183899 RepID=UPI00105E5EC7|nr:hypothetical protein [Arthrobacter sp. AG258]TDT74645.1 hypothetical protein DFO47_1124 [Arthrobacter sp. AG258]